MILDSRRRFSKAAALYERWRPSYPPALLDWIERTTMVRPGARVLDLGCGTGIVTRLFAARGFDVVGVDPNPSMLARARRLGGTYRRGEAAATGLPAGRADLVVCGQAFHWFEVAPALREIGRVLKPGKWCVVFWNAGARTPFMNAYRRLLREHSTEYEAIRGARETIRLIKAAGARGVRERSFANAQRLDREGLRGRVYSSSFVAHGLKRRAEFDRKLDALFERYQRRGAVTYAYRVLALAWRL